MFGIETPIGRTPCQGAPLDVTSPRAKAPDFAKRLDWATRLSSSKSRRSLVEVSPKSFDWAHAEVLRRGWFFGVTYHNMRGAIASATAAWAILLDRSAVIKKMSKLHGTDRSVPLFA